MSALKINFDTRFSDFDVIANEIKLFQNPYDSDIETLTPEVQMEIIDLQICLRTNIKIYLCWNFISRPLVQFDNLHKFARGLFSVFGTLFRNFA